MPLRSQYWPDYSGVSQLGDYIEFVVFLIREKEPLYYFVPEVRQYFQAPPRVRGISPRGPVISADAEIASWF
jgi:hypothetical protein